MMGVLINEINARHNDGRLLLRLFMGNLIWRHFYVC